MTPEPMLSHAAAEALRLIERAKRITLSPTDRRALAQAQTILADEDRAKGFGPEADLSAAFATFLTATADR